MQEIVVDGISAQATPSKIKNRTKHPLYVTWVQIRQRCQNVSHHKYHLYGARGIKVCKRWEDFDNFCFDMGGDKPPGTSIDRIDASKGYEPGNCRWATAKTQNRNRRSVLWVLKDGEVRCASDWAKIYGVANYTITRWVNKGWGERVSQPENLHN